MSPNIKDYPEVETDLPLEERLKTSIDLAISFWEANIEMIENQRGKVIVAVSQVIAIIHQRHPFTNWKLKPVSNELVLYLILDCEQATQRRLLEAETCRLLQDVPVKVLIVPQASA